MLIDEKESDKRLKPRDYKSDSVKKNWLTFIECLLYARHWAMCFIP